MQKMQDSENRMMWQDSTSLTLVRSERVVQVMIVRKFHINKGQKRNLDGHYKVLAAICTVGKLSPTTSKIKESSKQEMRVRDADVAKFGKKRLTINLLRSICGDTPSKSQQKRSNEKNEPEERLIEEKSS